MKTKYNKYLSIIAILVAVSLLSACDDSLLGENASSSSSSHSAAVSLSLSVEAESPTEGYTRSIAEGFVDEGVDTDGYIKDVWLIEFDEKDKRLGEPQYFTAEQLSTEKVELLLPDGAEAFKLVAIANTHAKEFGTKLQSCSTLQALAELNYDFTDFNTSGYREQNGVRDLMMNGFTELTSGMTDIEMKLYRNLAKVNIDITNLSTSSIAIKQVNVRMAAGKVRYADQIGGSAASSFRELTEYWTESSTSDVTYGLDNIAARKMSLMYYLPRNMSGDMPCESESMKNTVVPPNSTFVEILGETTDGDPVRYTFYIGKNMTGNFDIEPNYHYVLPIVITGKGDGQNDGRVEHFDSKVLKEANCYMLNYVACTSSAPFAQPMYTMTIDRINFFWLHPQNTNSDDKYVLHQGDEWVAEVIWQDTATDIFYFCDESGNKLSPAPHYYQSSWPDNKICVRPTGYGAGNVLIGIRKKNADPDTDGYMWSYHLWITDYNPDYKGVMDDEVQYYPVQGGSVHRYNTDYWKQNLPASDKICVMDRNLGAKNYICSIKDERSSAQGLLYQYGRKDPFVYGTIYRYIFTYDDNMNPKKEEIKSNVSYVSSDTYMKGQYGLTTVQNSINHPNWLYGNESYWCGNAIKANWTIYDWAVDEDGNSLFDPAPEGWRIPLANENYSNATISYETNVSYTTKIKDITGKAIRIAYFPYSYIIYVRESTGLIYPSSNTVFCRSMCIDLKAGGSYYYYWYSINKSSYSSRTCDAFPIRLIKESK